MQCRLPALSRGAHVRGVAVAKEDQEDEDLSDMVPQIRGCVADDALELEDRHLPVCVARSLGKYK